MNHSVPPDPPKRKRAPTPWHWYDDMRAIVTTALVKGADPAEALRERFGGMAEGDVQGRVRWLLERWPERRRGLPICRPAANER